ncbi:hypothetical protein DYB32_001716 [Aphanomyces invadans]|uniref:BAR domain-containing protein n=1 Tax=Aphanomyces invadans TaxID=157072 RepID=A0A418B5U2_9STRA|nr:hypothetical protein DYB32_001716 [Aphanomyces invadans]
MHQPTSPTAAHIHTYEPHGILDKFRSTKRRLIQQALTKMGKADCSDDSEYQVLRDRQLELTSNVEHVFVHMKSFVTNLVCAHKPCSDTPRRLRQKELEHRENLKLDYDSAVRKLRKARESREAADVLRRDEKVLSPP